MHGRVDQNTTFQNDDMLKRCLIGFATIRSLIARGTCGACPLWNRYPQICHTSTVQCNNQELNDIYTVHMRIPAELAFRKY